MDPFCAGLRRDFITTLAGQRGAACRWFVTTSPWLTCTAVMDGSADGGNKEWNGFTDTTHPDYVGTTMKENILGGIAMTRDNERLVAAFACITN